MRSDDAPVFLVHAEDDPTTDVAHSRILAEACGRAGIRHELHLPATGGHGFGMGRPGTASADWPGWYEAWLRRTGYAGVNPKSHPRPHPELAGG